MCTEKSFSEKVEYFRVLVKGLNGKTPSEVDSSLYYDVIYADICLADMITKVSSKILASELIDLRKPLGLVISNMPKKTVKSIRSKIDYKSILKTKYKDIDDSSFEHEIYEEVSPDYPIARYMMKSIGSFTVISFFVLLLISGVPRELIDDLVLSNISEKFKSVVIFIEFAVNFILLLILFVLSFISVVDMMYISIPSIRMWADRHSFKNKMDTVLAYSCVDNVDDTYIKYERIMDYSRVERNLYWLGTMLDNVDVVEKSGIKIPKNFKSKLLELKYSLGEAEEKSEDWYRYVARIEFLHDEYLEYIRR